MFMLFHSRLSGRKSEFHLIKLEKILKSVAIFYFIKCVRFISMVLHQLLFLMVEILVRSLRSPIAIKIKTEITVFRSRCLATAPKLLLRYLLILLRFAHLFTWRLGVGKCNKTKSKIPFEIFISYKSTYSQNKVEINWTHLPAMASLAKPIFMWE